jgi:hypothetical protein
VRADLLVALVIDKKADAPRRANRHSANNIGIHRRIEVDVERLKGESAIGGIGAGSGWR